MSSFELRRDRNFHSRNRVHTRSPPGSRGRFRGRSRERNISRDRKPKPERTRSKERFEMRFSRERLDRSRSREKRARRLSGDKFGSGTFREPSRFERRRSRSQDRVVWPSENRVEEPPPPIIGRGFSDMNNRFERYPDREELLDSVRPERQEFEGGSRNDFSYPERQDLPGNIQHSDYLPPDHQEFNENIGPSDFIQGDRQSFNDNVQRSEYSQEGPNYWRGRNQEFQTENAAVSPHKPLHFSPPAEVNIENKQSWNSRGNIPSLIPNFGLQKDSAVIAEFDPNNSKITSSQWIRNIDKIGNEKGWTSDERKLHFSSKLLGAGKEWFLSGTRILDPWHNLKKQFIQSFPSDMDYHKLLVDMIGRVKLPEESLSNYFNFKTVLMNTCNIRGRKAVSCLIGGLNESIGSIKFEALNQNFETAEELYNFLNTRMEDISKKDDKCYICRKPGHKAKKCPQKKFKSDKPESKYYKSVSLNGTSLRAFFDTKFPHIAIQFTEAKAANVVFKKDRGVKIINGYGQTKITPLGQAHVVLEIDNIVFDADIYVVRNNDIDTPMLLGNSIKNYANYLENNDFIKFLSPANKKPFHINHPHGRNSPEPKFESPSMTHKRTYQPPHPEWATYGRTTAMETGASNRLSPIRSPPASSPPWRSSPVRSPPPGRTFERSHPFLSKTFYGNPYL